METRKVTEGCVEQIFEDDKCVAQKFTAGDTVEYLNSQDKVLDPNFVEDHVGTIYQPFDMVQPGLDYYILKMEGCVEPVLVGPLTEEVAYERLKEYREDPSESQNSHTIFTVTKGAVVDS